MKTNESTARQLTLTVKKVANLSARQRVGNHTNMNNTTVITTMF